MTVQLSLDEIQILLNSLNYSRRSISDSQGTPSGIRNKELRELESIAAKLRTMQKSTDE